MSTPAIHTVPAGDSWENKREGTPAALSRHDTKEAAVAAGRQQAMQGKAEHIVHNQDGTISERNSYGYDPRSSKG